jgi:hypothetical protein
VLLLNTGLGLDRGLRNKPVGFLGVKIFGSSMGITLKYPVFLMGSILKK